MVELRNIQEDMCIVYHKINVYVKVNRARGITNPGEVFRYARQKEISIHGG